MKIISIQTKRLELRPYKMSDYQAWFHVYTKTHPKQSKHDFDPYSPEKCTREQFKSLIAKQRNLAKKDNTYVWGVFKKKTGEQIGLIDIHIICREELQKANLGYRIFNLYWGQGYAKESVTAAISLGLTSLKLNRLEVVIDLDNKASLQLAKSAGMRKEGIRKNYYYQEKNWFDQVVFVADRHDWGLPTLHPKLPRPI